MLTPIPALHQALDLSALLAETGDGSCRNGLPLPLSGTPESFPSTKGILIVTQSGRSESTLRGPHAPPVPAPRPRCVPGTCPPLLLQGLGAPGSIFSKGFAHACVPKLAHGDPEADTGAPGRAWCRGRWLGEVEPGSVWGQAQPQKSLQRQQDWASAKQALGPRPNEDSLWARDADLGAMCPCCLGLHVCEGPWVPVPLLAQTFWDLPGETDSQNGRV